MTRLTKTGAGVEVVVVGDELVLGDVADTNTAMLAQLLAAAGLVLTRSTCVGDDAEDLRGVLAEAVRRGPRAVLVAGGLGPTSDDRTRTALAALAGVPLRRDAALERDLAAWYAERGRDVPDPARQQADLPQGARPLPNRTGSAPGLVLPVGGVDVYCLPGVPSELIAMAREQVLPGLAVPGGALVQHVLRVVGVGESDVAARLAPLEAALAERSQPGAAGAGAAVRLGYLAVPGEVAVKLAAGGPDAPARLVPYLEQARALLGDLVATEDEPLPAAVHRLLRAAGSTCAAAESLTGGALGSALTEVPGASATFRGAVVAYSTAVKADVLGVDRALLAAVGAVHPKVAAQMASGVRRLLGATYGVATTGVAGPDEQDGQPVGTVHLAVAGPDASPVASSDAGSDVGAEPRVLSLQLRGDREAVRRAATAVALDLVRRAVRGHLPPGRG